ncbi:MAG TPA: amidohydrolase family protein [Planctomycetota bacterium]|nr:amidohydrolase family protein [Planctomycetota bacterium]
MRRALLPGLAAMAVVSCTSVPLRDRLEAYLDTVPAVDTHDHLAPFDRLPAFVRTERGRGMNLAALWRTSYFTWVHPLEPWKPGQRFADWWALAKDDFDDARATTFYRYLHGALRDLYGVEFDRLDDASAEALDRRIFENYRDPAWVSHVVRERAGIELMLVDPWWDRLGFRTAWPFEVLVFNVTPLIRGFHASEFKKPEDDPYAWAQREGVDVRSLDDYVALLDRLFRRAKEAGAVCLKTTVAYERTLRFEDVPAERARKAFGRPRGEVAPEDARDFEDYVMWRLVELSARHELPFQIHTGDARLEGSNPLLLLNLIRAHPGTRFVLFHGGYPWITETAAILMRHSANVWVDSVWLPTISDTAARRGFHEWLDVAPSNRILWGADGHHAEGIYGATKLTRRCLADVLAERVERGDLSESDARRIGRQILRDNALSLFPSLKARVRNP